KLYHEGEIISAKFSGRGQAPIHFKYETISLCHPERELWSCTLPGERSFAALRMTLLHRLRLTRNTSSLKWIGGKPGGGKPRPYTYSKSLSSEIEYGGFSIGTR